MDVVLLSQYPELLNESAELLNKQWKRSTSARVQSLEKSCTQLPDSLLLIEENENQRRVIGHSRLTRVLEDPYGCWIGSVVISEDKRKKGYGKYLMQKTEEYARVLQFSTVYLNTHDQQGFYEHLGYSYCDPVSSVSFSWNGYHPKNITVVKTNNQNMTVVDSESQKNIQLDNQIETKVTDISVPPPPPPPPLPLNRSTNLNNNLQSNLGQYWMKKKL